MVHRRGGLVLGSLIPCTLFYFFQLYLKACNHSLPPHRPPSSSSIGELSEQLANSIPKSQSRSHLSSRASTTPTSERAVEIANDSSDSPYYVRIKRYGEDLYDRLLNPDRFIQLGIAENKENGYISTDGESPRQLKGVQYPFVVSEKVMIKGNRRTPDKFVRRQAVITSQCLNDCGNPKDESGDIVCRVAPSFLRFGSYQIHASKGKDDLKIVRLLADYAIHHHFPHLEKIDKSEDLSFGPGQEGSASIDLTSNKYACIFWVSLVAFSLIFQDISLEDAILERSTCRKH